MRLYSTAARGLVDLPEPPGPIGMYVCGPTVYARAHIGNARPYVLACWYKRWLRERGYDVTLVHNITDVDDKIFVAAPGRSGERADEATAWYLEDVGAKTVALVCRQNIVTGEAWWEGMPPRQLRELAQALIDAQQ